VRSPDSDGVSHKDYGNRNRKQLVPAVVFFAKQETESETIYGLGRPARPPEAKNLRRQSQNFRKNYPQFANEQFEFGILKVEDNEEKEDEKRVNLNPRFDLSSL